MYNISSVSTNNTELISTLFSTLRTCSRYSTWHVARG